MTLNRENLLHRSWAENLTEKDKTLCKEKSLQRLDEATSGYGWTGEEGGKTGQDRTGDDRKGNDWTWRDRTEQNRVRQDKI